MTQYIEPVLEQSELQRMIAAGKIQFTCIAGHCWEKVPDSLPPGCECVHQDDCFIRDRDTFFLEDMNDLTWLSYEQVEKSKDSESDPEFETDLDDGLFDPIE